QPLGHPSAGVMSSSPLGDRTARKITRRMLPFSYPRFRLLSNAKIGFFDGFSLPLHLSLRQVKPKQRDGINCQIF
ncbi:MAG: hypothetical protein VW665_08040, partial [Candidatus Puniceispirillum sp.]